MITQDQSNADATFENTLQKRTTFLDEGTNQVIMQDSQQTAITAAIVNYNTRDLLRACLDSLRTEAVNQVVVIDNASTDGSIAMVKSEFPHVTIVANSEDIGYGAAANQVVKQCRTPYVLLLNSDTVIKPGAVAALRDYLDEHPRAAVVGPRLLNKDGTLQPSCFAFPTPLHVLLELNNARAVIRHIPILREWYFRTWSHAQMRVVPWLLGAALAIRRQVFESVGGFDDAFFMYFEETDLCYRIEDAGWESHFTPTARIVHLGGMSTMQQYPVMVLHLFRSRLIFYNHHYTFRQFIALKLITATSIGLKLLRDRLRLQMTHRLEHGQKLTEDVRIWQQVLHDLRGEAGVYGKH